MVLLLLPLVAMQVSDEVKWGPFDFALAGALLFGTALAFELAVRQVGQSRLPAGVRALALAAAFLLIWINLAVGIIGDEGEPANLLYVGVLAVGIGGATPGALRGRRDGARDGVDGGCRGGGRRAGAGSRLGGDRAKVAAGCRGADGVFRGDVWRVGVAVPAGGAGAGG